MANKVDAAPDDVANEAIGGVVFDGKAISLMSGVEVVQTLGKSDSSLSGNSQFSASQIRKALVLRYNTVMGTNAQPVPPTPPRGRYNVLDRQTLAIQLTNDKKIAAEVLPNFRATRVSTSTGSLSRAMTALDSSAAVLNTLRAQANVDPDGIHNIDNEDVHHNNEDSHSDSETQLHEPDDA